MLSEYLSRLPAGEVRTFFCADVAETLLSFEIGTATVTDKPVKVVVQAWATLPEQEQLLEDVLRTLADIALATWPFWYQLPPASALATLSATTLDTAALYPLHPIRQPIAGRWTKAAVQACLAGKPPLIPEFTRSQQLSQLALALDPGNLLILLVVHDRQPQPYRLLGLARVAEWMATTTAARLVVLVPRELATHNGLETIAYAATTLIDQPSPPAPLSDESAKSAIWPIQGRPHPFSPGEQLLAARLAQDPELATLFQCNEAVATLYQHRFWVDFLWDAGKLIIEIDGYRAHSSRTAFRHDRQRDYELLLSGYRVVRPNFMVAPTHRQPLMSSRSNCACAVVQARISRGWSVGNFMQPVNR